MKQQLYCTKVSKSTIYKQIIAENTIQHEMEHNLLQCRLLMYQVYQFIISNLRIGHFPENVSEIMRLSPSADCVNERRDLNRTKMYSPAEQCRGKEEERSIKRERIMHNNLFIIEVFFNAPFYNRSLL